MYSAYLIDVRVRTHSFFAALGFHVALTVPILSMLLLHHVFRSLISNMYSACLPLALLDIDWASQVGFPEARGLLLLSQSSYFF